MSVKVNISIDCRAVLLDLDGVITDTRLAHTKAWKQAMDDFLKHWSNSNKKPFVEFSDSDYNNHVDGLPRIDGIRRFLGSRNIDIPIGATEDVSLTSVDSLSLVKNKLYLEALQQEGAHIFEDARIFIEQIKKSKLYIGLVSSSKNAPYVLKSLNMDDVFDVIIDGNYIEQLDISPKPSAEPFLEAARSLKVDFSQCVVVEDSYHTLKNTATNGPLLAIGVDRTDGMALASNFVPCPVVAKLTDVKLETLG
ncbi:MAG: HAD hydrolase-like protein [Rhodospirillaceae bacterium]|jgi:beta-phosphoglucomutase family hydrolase|nr:HAD hydrolase-like protein [Rhodospirillaceae bacterium]